MRLARWALLLALISLAGCRPPSIQEQQAFVFGTRVELIVVSPDAALARQAMAEILQEFDRLHRRYHAWQPSELTTLNAAIADGRPQAVSDELAGFLRDAQSLSRCGGGLFDPGIGELIRLWGFHAEEFHAVLPPSGEIEAWLKNRPSILDLSIDPQQVVRSTNRHVQLDFGGYLKGVALDLAAKILHQHGLDNALINIGGNLLALGQRDGRPWRVGIQHPRQPGPLATLTLANGEAIGTSGDYQRYFEVAGERYSHLLDPRSGHPAAHTQSLTVLIPAGNNAGTLSDAASKPLFIAGPTDWPKYAKALGVSQVLRVDRSGQIQVSAEIKNRLTFSDPDLIVQTVE